MSDQDPRLSMFLDAWEQDVQDGKTVRSLHRSLDEHRAEDARRFTQVDGEIRKLREARAKEQGRVKGRRDSSTNEGGIGVNGTGRHTIVTASDGAIVSVGDGERGARHSSRPPWLVKALGHAITKHVGHTLLALLLVAIGWVLHRLGVTP